MAPVIFRQQNPKHSAQMRLAQSLMQRGTDTSPVQHPAQALARIAQALSGAYTQKRATEEDTADRGAALTALMQGMQKPRLQPGMAQSALGNQVTPESLEDSGEGGMPGIPEQRAQMTMPQPPPPGGMMGGAEALAGLPKNYYAQQMAPQLAIGAQQQQMALAAQLAAEQRALANKIKLKQTPDGPNSPTGRPASGIQLNNEYRRILKNEGQEAADFFLKQFGNPPYMNLGGGFISRADASSGRTEPTILATPKPGDQPRVAAAKAGAATTGAQAAKRTGAEYQAALSGLDTIEKSSALIEHLKTSEAITGAGAEMFKGIERVKALMGDKVAQGKVADTEVLDAMMGGEVFGLMKSLGVGARGLDTPAEREFMRSVLTGKIALNKNTLIRMAEIRQSIGQKAVNKWNARYDKGELENWYAASGITPGRLGGKAAASGNTTSNDKNDPLGLR